ncbi:MAG: DUF4127 family protein [Firmicutes bacterium]|nr:DUF4127 family protein [Bacillota bacterium]
MKKLHTLLSAMIFSILMVTSVRAATIITAPVDSRPVSVDYLEKLTRLNNDEFICVDKQYLDKFTQTGSGDHIADSAEVRRQIDEYVSTHNTSDTTVIINTSSYLTNGLVGSRIGNSYSDLESALAQLHTLISTYKEPTYYINISMPRTLPEKRLNAVWRDTKPVKGLCYYYLKYNESSPNRSYINSNLVRVHPIQLLLEYVYLYNKQQELGKDNIALWEKEFIEEFDKNYKKNEPYKSYIENYIRPYRCTSQIYSKVSAWNKAGLIDEIIIGVDDFQLPDSMIYLSANEPGDWIGYDENGAPIKYSYARTYLLNGEGSIYKKLVSDIGRSDALDSYNARGKNINFIFGTDEIPQLIYARDVSKRTGLSANFTLHTGSADGISKYDLLANEKILRNAISFVSYSKKKTKGEFDLFIYEYGNKNNSCENTYQMMNSKYRSGSDIGLIELFDGNSNLLFNKLANTQSDTDFDMTDLSMYCAWNTSANAIGLGVAHAQVYSAAKQTTTDDKKFIAAQTDILITHLLEDGKYTNHGKKALSNKGYIPTADNSHNNEELYNILDPQPILDKFSGKIYTLNDKSYEIDNCILTDYDFPWTRLFDCYLNITCDVNEYK